MWVGPKPGADIELPVTARKIIRATGVKVRWLG